GGSSSTVSDLYDYMRSLTLLASLRVETLCPGHGPVVPPPRGGRLVAWYINHRNEREAQVLAALKKGITQVDEMVRDIYPRNLKKDLRQAAARNVRTHLDKLVKEGRVLGGEVSYTLAPGRE
ncbi:MAG: MBL fold metallo-hydrolase, partial [Chloroflexi bacterium]|nr:MBL fold metallo-hydrolase [Chloroflexota bacterium]